MIHISKLGFFAGIIVITSVVFAGCLGPNNQQKAVSTQQDQETQQMMDETDPIELNEKMELEQLNAAEDAAVVAEQTLKSIDASLEHTTDAIDQDQLSDENLGL